VSLDQSLAERHERRRSLGQADRRDQAPKALDVGARERPGIRRLGKYRPEHPVGIRRACFPEEQLGKDDFERRWTTAKRETPSPLPEPWR
jgi:hypothetical protein